jgi:hypothetical protein
MLVVAGVWNALLEERVTVSSPPSSKAGTPPSSAMHEYYLWYAGIAGQERAATLLAAAGVVGLVLLVETLRNRAFEVFGRLACTMVMIGGLVWIVGALVAVGGHRAVALMATHGNPVEGVNTVAFSVDMTSDAFSVAAFVLLGLAMIGLGTVRARSGWKVLSWLTGIVSLVVAYGYVDSIGAITTYVLAVLAAVLLPLWLVWSGRLLDLNPEAASVE